MEKIFLSVDLDGTLLNNQAMISPFSVQVIQDFINKSSFNFFLLNSGRPMGHMKNFLKIILKDVKEENKKNVFAASDNGCWLIDSQENTLFKDSFKPALIKHLWISAVKLGLNPFIHISGNTYLARMTDKAKKIIKRHSAIMKLNSKPQIVKNLDHVKDAIDVPKFTIIEDNDDLKPVALKFIIDNSKINNMIYVTSENIFFMIMAGQRTKASPIDFLMNKYQIKRNNIYVFGDSDNDVKAFSTTQNVVVPFSAAKEIRALGKYIAGHHNNNGVAIFIKNKFIHS